MSKLYFNILSVILGFLIGSINFFFLFALVRRAFFSKKDLSRKGKAGIALAASLKFLLILVAFYLVVVIFKFNVLYILIGFTLSLFLISFFIKRFKV